VSNEIPLSQADQQALRSKGIISDSEVALKVGDLIVVENVVTKSRRTIDSSSLILESTRRVLKG
jgi:hypothetical protein